MNKIRKREERFEIAYKIYIAIKKISKESPKDITYIARALGQLIYNKFGKQIVGISENAINEIQQNLTEDHFNNCQKVGEYLVNSEILSKEDFQSLIEESRKTIIVTKKENSILRKYQKNKDYGKGLEAYKEAQIQITFY